MLQGILCNAGDVWVHFRVEYREIERNFGRMWGGYGSRIGLACEGIEVERPR